MVHHDDAVRELYERYPYPAANDDLSGLIAGAHRPAWNPRDSHAHYFCDQPPGRTLDILIAGEPVPYALARIPKAGETRGNLAAGGLGVARPLTPRDWEIARSLGPPLWAEGLLIVGLDVIGDHLTEVNVTSPTGVQEIDRLDGVNLEGKVIDFVESQVLDLTR